MKKTTIIVMFVTVLAKIVGFARDVYLNTYFYGGVSDAFITASAIPNTIINVVLAAFVTGIIPMLSRMKDKEKVNNFTNNLLNILMMVALGVSIFLLFFPELSVRMFGGKGFTGDQFLLATYFVRIISLSVIAMVVTQLGTGYLNVKGTFIIPAAITIPSNLCVIVGMIFASKTDNLNLLMGAQLVGIIFQGLIIFWVMMRKGFRYRAFIDFKDEDLKIMLGLSLPIVITSFVGQLNDVMLRNVISDIGADGAITKLNNSTKMIGFVQGIFVTGVLTVSYPKIAKNVQTGDRRLIMNSFAETTLMLMLTVLPALVGFLTLSHEIITFVFQRGEVTPEVINQIVPIFMAYTLVLIPAASRDLMNRVFYSYEDMMTPAKNSVLYSVVFIPVMMLVGYVFKGTPYAIALTVLVMPLTNALVSFKMYKDLKRKISFLSFKPISKELIKLMIASLVMGAVIILVKLTMGKAISSNALRLIVDIIIGVVVYVVMLVALRSQFFLSLLQSLLAKRSK